MAPQTPRIVASTLHTRRAVQPGHRDGGGEEHVSSVLTKPSAMSGPSGARNPFLYCSPAKPGVGAKLSAGWIAIAAGLFVRYTVRKAKCPHEFSQLIRLALRGT